MTSHLPIQLLLVGCVGNEHFRPIPLAFVQNGEIKETNPPHVIPRNESVSFTRCIEHIQLISCVVDAETADEVLLSHIQIGSRQRQVSNQVIEELTTSNNPLSFPPLFPPDSDALPQPLHLGEEGVIHF